MDAKTGSSAAGSRSTPSSRHPKRSGTMRMYAPTGHRHTPEIEQECGLEGCVHLTVHSVEAVRGILSTVHVSAPGAVDRKELWRIFRDGCFPL